jgi:hypothetical protein
MKRVFVSYSHKQGEWVFDSLVPCLTAGGAGVLIDRQRFEAGLSLFTQMDTLQDQADVHVLVFSPDYLASAACLHEMDRAVDQDPAFQLKRVIPLMRNKSVLPSTILTPNPLYVNLTDDRITSEWDLLLNACGADLGIGAPQWLEARHDVIEHLARRQSVNLVVKGAVKRREFLDQIRAAVKGNFATVDLDSGATVSRRALVSEILNAFGVAVPVPEEREDLPFLYHRMMDLKEPALCLSHFDRVAHRAYGLDFFSTLKHLVMDEHKLTLLIESRAPYSSFLPSDNSLTKLQTVVVELTGR